jgi:hypothetical protein
MKSDPESPQQLIEPVKNKQRNTVWPDTLLNSRGVDEYLWKGSSDAPLVQRIGAVVFGVAFMLGSVGLIEADRETTPDRKSIVVVILGVAFFAVGLKVLLNGLRWRKRKTGNTQ